MRSWFTSSESHSRITDLTPSQSGQNKEHELESASKRQMEGAPGGYRAVLLKAEMGAEGRSGEAVESLEAPPEAAGQEPLNKENRQACGRKYNWQPMISPLLPREWPHTADIFKSAVSSPPG